MNGSVVFFEEYENYKPDINKMDEESYVNVILYCRENFLKSFERICVCDMEFMDA